MVFPHLACDDGGDGDDDGVARDDGGDHVCCVLHHGLPMAYPFHQRYRCQIRPRPWHVLVFCLAVNSLFAAAAYRQSRRSLVRFAASDSHVMALTILAHYQDPRTFAQTLS